MSLGMAPQATWDGGGRTWRGNVLYKEFSQWQKWCQELFLLCNRHWHAKPATATENRTSCGTCCRKDYKCISHL